MVRNLKNNIVIVSGIPRSGTTMMMRMLEAGGIVPMKDNFRQADEDNPRGYYELEKVKSLEKDSSWLLEANGKAIKVISALLTQLPSNLDYQIIFMTRNMSEILASQEKMLKRQGRELGRLLNNEMAEKFKIHLEKTFNWLAQQKNIHTITVDYNRMMQYPEKQINQIVDFLKKPLDKEKMISIVDKTLYRQRDRKISNLK